MTTIGDIIGGYYQKLQPICEKQGITLNLDLEDSTTRIFNEKALKDFLQEQITEAVENCKGIKNAHITIVQKSVAGSNLSRFSIRNDGKTLTDKKKQGLKDKGYEVRARYGFDTIVSIKL